MEGKVLARIAAIAFVAIAITATVIEVTREEAPVDARKLRKGRGYPCGRHIRS